ncbi:hypothetical protein Agub_g14292, partial [Astrephomene gubernaculifera]
VSFRVFIRVIVERLHVIMSTLTIRPFASTVRGHSGAPLRPAKFTRIALLPVASSKGFGDPKKDAAVKPTQQAQQQRQAATAVQSPPPAPTTTPAAASSPRARVARETPQVVVDRIFRRILVCSGLPVFTGMALFPVFYWLRVVQDIEYPLWIVYIAQLLTFGGGLAGITYGALSASWDPSREGSVLGWRELQANLSIVMNNRNNKVEP